MGFEVFSNLTLSKYYDYELSHEPVIGKIYPRRSQSEAFTLRLDRDYDYALMGVCDQDCKDIDIKLYDNNGNLVDADTKPDDTAYIHYEPGRNGLFHIEVNIPACTEWKCTYGIGVFAKEKEQASVPNMNARTLVQIIQKEYDYVLVDARKANDYQKGHIPTAQSVPYLELDEKWHLLPKNKDTLLIFYCWDEECGWSTEAAGIAQKFGYRHVVTYAAGFNGWLQDGYAPCDHARAY